MEITVAQLSDLNARARRGEANLKDDIHELRAGVILIYLELRDEATPQDKARLTRLVTKWIEELPNA